MAHHRWPRTTRACPGADEIDRQCWRAIGLIEHHAVDPLEHSVEFLCSLGVEACVEFEEWLAQRLHELDDPKLEILDHVWVGRVIRTCNRSSYEGIARTMVA